MQNSIYKIKYLLFLSWDWEAWCLTGGGVIPHPERNTVWNKGRKCFHCLGAPNNLIRSCQFHEGDCVFRSWSKNSSPFMESKGLSTFSQESPTESFPGPVQSSSHDYVLFVWDPLYLFKISEEKLLIPFSYSLCKLLVLFLSPASIS